MTTIPDCFHSDETCRGALHAVYGDLWCSEHLRLLALDAILDHADPACEATPEQRADAIHHWSAVLGVLSLIAQPADRLAAFLRHGGER